MLFYYSIVSYLYVSCSGSITSVGEERELRNIDGLGIILLIFGMP